MSSYPLVYSGLSSESSDSTQSFYSLTSIWWLVAITLVLLIFFILFSIFYLYIPLRNARNRVDELFREVNSGTDNIKTVSSNTQQIRDDLNKIAPVVQQVGDDINELTPKVDKLVTNVDKLVVDIDENFKQILDDINTLPQIRDDLNKLITAACEVDPTLSICPQPLLMPLTPPTGTNGLTAGTTAGLNGTPALNPFVDPQCQINSSQVRRNFKKGFPQIKKIFRKF